MIRVVFVDDHPIVLSGIELFFQTVSDIAVVGTFRNGASLWSAFRAGELPEFDVLVVDIDVPGLDGVQLFDRLKEECPEIPVLFYTRQPEDQYAIALLRRGAAGFISKDRETDALVEAIYCAHRGDVYLTPRISRMLVDRPMSEEEPHYRLSPREREVFDLFVSGRPPGQIAAELEAMKR